jgi:hypothetical protein
MRTGRDQVVILCFMACIVIAAVVGASLFADIGHDREPFIAAAAWALAAAVSFGFLLLGSARRQTENAIRQDRS